MTQDEWGLHPVIRYNCTTISVLTVRKVLLAPVTTGTLAVHWPEGNVLVDPKARSPLAKIPAYKEISATLERANGVEEREPILKL